MGDLPTIKVKAGDDFAIINRADYDPNVHELHDDESKTSAGGNDPHADELARRDALRTAEANRGVTAGPGLASTDRNPSGTFSEPTPTDIRFPDKTATEFENNFGAHIGKSAAEMREGMGLPDAPGGLQPAGTGEGAQVEIPDNWQDMHWKQQVKLASDLGLGDDLAAADARAAIQAEADRRVAPVTPAAPQSAES